MEVGGIWLTPLGADGEPTSETYLFMAPKSQPYILDLEFEPIPSTGNLDTFGEWSLECVIPEIPLGILELLSPEAAEYVREERYALAVWEGEGGSSVH